MTTNTGAFQHDKTAGHDEWLTPPEIVNVTEVDLEDEEVNDE